MSATIDFVRVERVQSGSAKLGTQSYRVDFEFTDSEGPPGLLAPTQELDPRHRLYGSVSIELPVLAVKEAEIVEKARKALLTALVRLSAVAR